MGLWYFLIILLGIALIIIGGLNKNVSKSTKIVILCFVLGIFLILTGLLLFLPGSSVILDQLFQLS